MCKECAREFTDMDEGEEEQPDPVQQAIEQLPPGPWIARRDTDGDFSIFDAAGSAVGWPRMSLLKPTHAAMSHLWAAAPELLELLAEARGQLTRFLPTKCGIADCRACTNNSDIFARIDSAIARATGKETTA